MGDARRLIHEYVLEVAERPIRAEQEANRGPDQAVWNAIAAKRAWLDGAITDDELEKANESVEESLWLYWRLPWTPSQTLQVFPVERLIGGLTAPDVRAAKNLVKGFLPAIVTAKVRQPQQSRKQFITRFDAELSLFNAELEWRLTEAFGDTGSA